MGQLGGDAVTRWILAAGFALLAVAAAIKLVLLIRADLRDLKNRGEDDEEDLPVQPCELTEVKHRCNKPYVEPKVNQRLRAMEPDFVDVPSWERLADLYLIPEETR